MARLLFNYKKKINMKKRILLTALLFTITLSFSQRLVNDKYELFLLNIEENEVNIAKGMYMTDNKQYYYEGNIEVSSLENGKITKYAFFFSSWDDKYKEFSIRDTNSNFMNPVLIFDDKITAIIKGDKTKTFKLKNNSSIENSILSSMLIWLDNRK